MDIIDLCTVLLHPSKTNPAPFRDAFAAHFEPWQFAVATRGGCETIVHGLRATFDLHPDWVVLQIDIRNAFNTISWEAIFHELCSAPGTLDPLFPFVRSFYSQHSPLYFVMGTCTGDISTLFSRGHTSGDPLGGALFALGHLRALCSTAAAHPLCIFPSYADDTYIAGPIDAVLPAFHILQDQLSSVGLTIQPAKSTAWCPQGLPPSFSLPQGFCVSTTGLRILGAPLGPDPFLSTHLQ
ncbi:hypothetical protein R1flu_012150 [Riccia fluitans]|uniref:Reverse transcriptase domain-containing protein n=1 Tax=Riccia fluitans TaxID=41844 RepID=A0ABD1Z9T2_9MARC